MSNNSKENRISALGGATLLALACLTIMVGCIIVPGINDLAAAFGMESNASFLITLPSLGVVLCGPFAGRFIDRCGAYTAICWGLFFYGLLGFSGIFMTCLPNSVTWLFVDRFLLGGACAVVMSSGTGLISSFYSGQQRLKMIALQGMSIELGGVIFLSVGGALATIGWQYPFALYLIAWLFLVMVIAFIHEPEVIEDDSAAIDEETPGDGPKANLKLVYLAAFISLTCFFSGVLVIPQEFKILGIGVAQTGYFLSLMSLIAVFAAGIMPRVVSCDKLSKHIRMSGENAALFLAFGCYTISLLIYSFASSFILFIPGALFIGMGFGLSIPLLNHMTVKKSLARNRGKNLSYLAMAIYSGQFMASILDMLPGDPWVVFMTAAVIALVMNLVLIKPCFKHNSKVPI
jgi:MFS family permease